MLLNIYQAYTMEVLKQLKYIRCEQLAWLMARRFGSTEEHVKRNLRQLRYANSIALDGEDCDFVCLPGRKRDDALINAVDVMRSICGHALPEFMAGVPPCKLSFFIRDERGYLDFKVIPVLMGEERLVSAKLQTVAPDFICTFLFLIQDQSQIPLLWTQNPAYYVLPKDNGGYTFLKKGHEKEVGG